MTDDTHSGHAPVSTDRLDRTLRTVARIVAGPGGEKYIALFERLESEMAARERMSDARARARALAAQHTPAANPSNKESKP